MKHMKVFDQGFSQTSRVSRKPSGTHRRWGTLGLVKVRNVSLGDASERTSPAGPCCMIRIHVLAGKGGQPNGRMDKV